MMKLRSPEMLLACWFFEIRPRIACALSFCLLLLAGGGCASKPVPASSLPPVTTFNWGAGCGDHLLVTLRIEESEEGLFCLDTGCPITVVSKSWEQKLGKPIGRQKMRFPWYPEGKSVASKHAWPKLSLGDTTLLPGKFVVVSDFINQGPKGRRYAGVLGMDCLQHYCIQLDFDKRTISFLDSAQLNTNDLGHAYPLVYSHSAAPFRSGKPQYPFPFGMMWGNLFAKAEYLGRTEWYLVDTGDSADGSLDNARLKEAEKLQPSITSAAIAEDTLLIRNTAVPVFSFGGNRYTNLLMRSLEASRENTLGLRVLARNLVTFDFPRQTMYLKQRHVGPLELYSDGEQEAFRAFITARKMNGDLPGLDKDAKGTLTPELGHEPETYSFHAAGEQAGDTTLYYRFGRNAAKNWVLLRAWRTDRTSKVIEEYPIP
jgi:hypothetical protein